MYRANVADLIAQHARHTPDAPALIDGDRVIDYAGLDNLVTKTAAHLARLGARPGERIAICLKDRPEHVIALLGAGRMGAVGVPIDWRAREAEKARLIAAFGLSLALIEPGASALPATRSIAVDDSWARAVDAAPAVPPPALAADGAFHIALTSGTTGVPKGVAVSHAQQIIRFLALAHSLGETRQARYFSATPLCFAAGRTHCLFHLMAGNSVILYPPLFTAGEFVDAAVAARADCAFVVPTVLRWLLDLKGRAAPLLPGLRYLIAAGAPLSAEEKIAALRLISPRFHETYGASAAGVISILTPEAIAERPDSVGQPILLTEVEAVDDQDRPLVAGQVGHLRCRGPGIGTPIHGRSEGSPVDETMRDGWYYPGELAAVDARGNIFLKGRASSLIIRGGVNIYPEEIEAVLLAHPAVAEAACIGASSRDYGEDIVAFVVARDPSAAMEIEAHCRRELASYKVPRRIVVVERLPKSASGKVKRAELAALLAAETNCPHDD